MSVSLSEILIIVALVLANGVFAGAEIAVLSFRKTRLRELLEEGGASAKAIASLRDQPERFLATVQIGITVIGATAGAFGGASVARHLKLALESAGLTAAVAHDVSLAAVIMLVSFLSLVLGELVPKSLALRHSEGYSLLVARPLRALAFIARPLVWFLTASSNVVLRIFGDRTSFSEARLSRDELQQLVEEATKTGALDPQAGEIASRAFDFEELTIEAVMIPRQRVVALPRHASMDQIKVALLEQGHSRLPVFEDSLDQVVGYVLAKDVLAVSWQQPMVLLEDIIRPAYFVPETMRAVTVLKELQRRRTHLAIVVDVQGALVGLVTIEDLLEELVGEIFSEHEKPVQLIQTDRDGSHLVQGTAPVREVNRTLQLNLDDTDGTATIAGLCIELAGAIPAVGDKLKARDGTLLEIADASPRRVRLVRVRHPTGQGPS